MLKNMLLNGASQVTLEVKNPSANAGDMGDVGSIPELGRSPGDGKWQPTSVFLMESLMDRGAWWATILQVTKNHTQLND